MTDLEGDIWYWHHNISECYYHIQITIKYRRSVLEPKAQETILETMNGFKERYAIVISDVGFDQNHVHLLCRFLPTYAGGKVVGLIKHITAKEVFLKLPEVKKWLWGGEFWTDGYYIATVSGKGNRAIIENYIRKQGRAQDVSQLRLFNIEDS